jgi:hypothetical protein
MLELASGWDELHGPMTVRIKEREEMLATSRCDEGV